MQWAAEEHVSSPALQRKKTVGSGLEAPPPFGRMERLQGKSLTLDMINVNELHMEKNGPCDTWHLVFLTERDSLHPHVGTASATLSYFSEFWKLVSEGQSSSISLLP